MNGKSEVRLVNFPACVQGRILSYLGDSEGGVQALLNLRKTCRQTKGWIDDLPLVTAKRIFSKAQVNGGIHVGAVNSFLHHLPPKGITSLVFTQSGCGQTLRLSNITPVEEEEIWERFTRYWRGRLESLEVTLGNTSPRTQGRILEFLSEPILSFKCKRVNTNLPFDYSSVLRQLVRNANLRRFETIFYSMADVEFFRNLLRAKREVDNFTMSLSFGPPLLVPFVPLPRDRAIIRTLISAIVNCSCTVLLKGYNWNIDDLLMTRELCDEEIRKLFGCIESMCCDIHMGMPDDLMDLSNLKILSVNHKASCGFWESFPSGLKSLSLGEGAQCPPYQILPSGLTELEYHHGTSSLKNLFEEMAVLSSTCPLLESLKITWKCELKSQVPPPCRINFSNLRRLSFIGTAEEDDVKDVANCLFKSLQIHSRPLKQLELKFETYEMKKARVIDEEILQQFCDGILGSNILINEIKRDVVEAKAVPTYFRLERMAAMNNVRSKEAFGNSELRKFKRRVF